MSHSHIFERIYVERTPEGKLVLPIRSDRIGSYSDPQGTDGATFHLLESDAEADRVRTALLAGQLPADEDEPERTMGETTFYAGGVL